MRLFLAKQLASHPVINRQKITTNGNTLYPSQQKFGPSTSQTRTTNKNSNNFTPQ